MYARHHEPDPWRVAAIALLVVGAVGIVAVLPAVGLVMGWWCRRPVAGLIGEGALGVLAAVAVGAAAWWLPDLLVWLVS